MVDPVPAPDASHEETATPRWVKVFGIVAVVIVLLLVIVLLVGGGNHSPGRHMSSSDTAELGTP